MNETDKRIDTFTPRSLPGEAWFVAAPAVRALTRSAEPADATHAKNLASRLCGFLATQPLWDQAGVPDLRALLSADAIRAHCDRLTARGKSPSTVRYVRKDLHRLARAAAGLPPKVSARRHRPAERAAVDPILVGLLESGLSTNVASTAWQKLTGRPVYEHLLTAAIRALAPAGDFAAAVAGSRDVEPNIDAGPAAGQARPAGVPRRLSRAATIREAKRALAVKKSLAAGPVLTEAPDDLPSDVAAAIDAYRPSDVPDEAWAAIAPAWRRLMSGYRPAAPRSVSTGGRHLVNFLTWFACHGPRTTGGPVTPGELLTPGLVDAWVLTLATKPTSRATARSMVRRAVASLTPAENARTFAHQPTSRPYTPAECADFRNLALNQPTAAKRRNLCFVVGLAAGAGLSGVDLRSLRRNDIRPRTLPDGTRVTVVDVPGPRARTTVVRAQYAPLVVEACRLHDETIADGDQLVIGVKRSRTNVTTPAIDRAVTAIDRQRVTIDTNRLRTTWLVALLSSPVPLAAILTAAGLTTGRTITDLLPYCATPDPGQVAAALAAAHTDQAAAK